MWVFFANAIDITPEPPATSSSFAVLRKIEIIRQRLGVRLVQVKQHLGKVFSLVRVALIPFR